MEIKSDIRDGISIVELYGNLDGNSAPQLQEEVERIAGPDCSCLMLGMKDCEFVSSAGLRVLLISAKLLKNNNGSVILAGLSDEVKEVMEMTGFEPYFKYYESIEEALEVEVNK